MTDFERNEEYKRWLQNATDLDVYVGSDLPQFKQLRDDLFKGLSRKIEFKNEPKFKEAIKTILLNLWAGIQQGVPVMYSRNPNCYSQARRYGMLHFKFNRIIPIFDELERMGLVHQEIGYQNNKDKTRRRTRTFAKGDLFQALTNDIPLSFDVIEKLPPAEIVQLKSKKANGIKKLINYEDNQFTNDIRFRLTEYNGFLQDQSIQIEIPGDFPLTHKKWQYFYSGIVKGMIQLNRLELLDNHNPNSDKTGISLLNNHYHDYQHTIHRYPRSTFIPYHVSIDTSNHIGHSYNLSITNKILRVMMNKGFAGSQEKSFSLNQFGISKLVFDVKYEFSHRVFNNNSFRCGGRFFGGYHLGMDKGIRKNHILINGKPTIELDYSALHPRMLYNAKGINYREDPYEVICGNPDERTMFKIVQLICLNAETEKKAIKAIRKRFVKKRIQYDLTDKSIQSLIDRFKAVHRPIEEFYNSGVGISLQYLDSCITDIIIMHLVYLGIPVLTVHDSYIVEEAHQSILEEKMVEAYEAILGYPPIIEIVGNNTSQN